MKLLALTLAVLSVLGPCATDSTRAPDWIVCPRCDQTTWVSVLSESQMLDHAVTYVDCKSRTHFHDIGWHQYTCRCCRCLCEWSVTVRPNPCWCGWAWDHPVGLPECS